MSKPSKFDLILQYTLAEKRRLLHKAEQLSRSLTSYAEQLKVATENDDLSRIAWLSKSLDLELSVQAETTYATLHLLEGLKTYESD